MSTQRDRLAAVLLEAAAGREDPPLMEMADALLARGVRVVDDPERFDQDERDAKAEAEFLRPIQ